MVVWCSKAGRLLMSMLVMIKMASFLQKDLWLAVRQERKIFHSFRLKRSKFLRPLVLWAKRVAVGLARWADLWPLLVWYKT